MTSENTKWTKVKLNYNKSKNQWQMVYSAKSIPLGEDANGIKRYKPVRKIVSIPIPLGYHRTYDPKTNQEINLPKDKKVHNQKRRDELNLLEAEYRRDLTNGLYHINQARVSGERVIDWIENWMKAQTHAKNTKDGYLTLISHMKQVENPHFLSFDTSYINKFIKHLNKLRDAGKIKQTTIRTYYDRLVYIMKCAEKNKKIYGVEAMFDSANDVPYGDSDIGNYFSLEQLKVLAKTECRYPIIKRAFLFQCLTGLRFTEMMNLYWRDVKEKDGTITVDVLSRKNKLSQVVPVSQGAMEWAGKRTGSNDKVFIGLTYSDMNYRLTEWVKSAGIDHEKTVTHDARRTCAYIIWKNTKDIDTVGKYLNHKNIAETQRYLAKHLGDAFMELDANSVIPNISI